MHVVSQIAFYVDKYKVICHLYNTTQKILVNGHGYKRLADIFLKPFFEAKVENSIMDIQKVNEEVLQKYGAKTTKTVKRSNVKFNSGSTLVHLFACNQCDSTFRNLSSLNKHRNTQHTKAISFNYSNNLSLPLQQ